ncbi:hypothetical protein ACFLYA_02495, partial [Candidatus Dependentiae bacterium]
LKKEKELMKIKNPKNLHHTIVLTGGDHSKRIQKTLRTQFDYTKKYVSKIPKTKAKYRIAAPEEIEIDTILHLETCFKKGLRVLKNELENEQKALIDSRYITIDRI